jgi:hypothetical protein
MRSIPSIGIPGEKTRDTTLMISLVTEQIRDKAPDYVFGDAGGVGGPIMDGIRQMVKSVPIVDVQFGGKSPDQRYGDWRAYMYAQHKEWLQYGCIEDSDELEMELTAPEYYHIKDKLRIESKEDMEARNVDSPDWADSEILTHAMPVVAKKQVSVVRGFVPVRRPEPSKTGRGWMRA